MFYMYVHKFIGKQKLKLKTKLFLILPFFIVLLIHVLQVVFNYTSNNIHKVSSHFQRGIYVYIEFLSFIFNVLIMYFVHKMILKA